MGFIVRVRRFARRGRECKGVGHLTRTASETVLSLQLHMHAFVTVLPQSCFLAFCLWSVKMYTRTDDFSNVFEWNVGPERKIFSLDNRK